MTSVTKIEATNSFQFSNKINDLFSEYDLWMKFDNQNYSHNEESLQKYKDVSHVCYFVCGSKLCDMSSAHTGGWPKTGK